jgi:hypothetical protein
MAREIDVKKLLNKTDPCGESSVSGSVSPSSLTRQCTSCRYKSAKGWIRNISNDTEAAYPQQ